MTVTVRNTGCCGLKELDNLGTEPTPEQAMTTLRQEWRGNLLRCTFILFTGVTDRVTDDHTHVRREDDYGKGFANFIEEHNLGTVVSTTSKRNPKTGNNIGAWIWTVDHAAVTAWYAKWDEAHPIKDLADAMPWEPGGQAVNPPGVGYFMNEAAPRPATPNMRQVFENYMRMRAQAPAQNWRIDGIPINELEMADRGATTRAAALALA